MTLATVLGLLAGLLAVIAPTPSPVSAQDSTCFGYHQTDHDDAKKSYSETCGVTYSDTSGLHKCVWSPDGWRCEGPGKKISPTQQTKLETPTRLWFAIDYNASNPEGTLAWKAVDGATKYNIDRNGEYLTTVSENELVIPHEPSTYEVYALGATNGVQSSKSKPYVVTEARKPNPPAIIEVVKKPTYVSVLWALNPRVKGVNVYRNGDWVASVNSPGRGLTDVDGQVGDKYSVQAYSYADAYSDRSPEVAAALGNGCSAVGGIQTIKNVQPMVTSSTEMTVSFTGDCDATRHNFLVRQDNGRARYLQVSGKRSSVTFTVEPYAVYRVKSTSFIQGRTRTGAEFQVQALPLSQAAARSIDRSGMGVSVIHTANTLVGAQSAQASAGTGVVLGLVGVGLAVPPFSAVSWPTGIALGALAYSVDGYNGAVDAKYNGLEEFHHALDQFMEEEGIGAFPEAGAYGHNRMYPEVEAWESLLKDLPRMIAEEFDWTDPDLNKLGRFLDGLVVDFRKKWGKPAVRLPNRPAFEPSCVSTGACNDNHDLDNDGTPDLIDNDRDGDGIPNTIDRYPDTEYRSDQDGDGTADQDDPDIDGDGIPNGIDAKPTVPYVAPTTTPGREDGDDEPWTGPSVVDLPPDPPRGDTCYGYC